MPTGTIWVTGARGFLGRYVARRFARDCWSVAGIGRGEWASADAAAWGVTHWLQEEVTSATLQRLEPLHGRPDVLVHAAGGSSVGRSLADPKADFYATVGSTAEVLTYLRSRAPECRLVLTSSAAVYGIRDQARISEDAGVAPVSPYGLHKSFAEQLCLAPGRTGSSLVLRLFSLYGPDLRKQLLWDIANKVSANPNILNLRGTGLETRDMLHVADAADCVFAAVTGRSDGVLNIASGRSMTVREIAEVTAIAFGYHPRIVFDNAETPADPPHLQADITRLKRLGCQPRFTFEQGAREYADWFRGIAL